MCQWKCEMHVLINTAREVKKLPGKKVDKNIYRICFKEINELIEDGMTRFGSSEACVSTSPLDS